MRVPRLRFSLLAWIVMMNLAVLLLWVNLRWESKFASLNHDKGERGWPVTFEFARDYAFRLENTHISIVHLAIDLIVALTIILAAGLLIVWTQNAWRRKRYSLLARVVMMNLAGLLLWANLKWEVTWWSLNIEEGGRGWPVTFEFAQSYTFRLENTHISKVNLAIDLIVALTIILAVGLLIVWTQNSWRRKQEPPPTAPDNQQ